MLGILGFFKAVWVNVVPPLLEVACKLVGAVKDTSTL